MDTVTPEEIAAFFARRAEARDRRDSAAYAASYSEDCVIESSGITRRGRTAVEQAFRHLYTAFPDWQTETEEFLSFGNRVVYTGIVQGTDTGGFLGQPPTGKAFRLFVIVLYTLSDGQIVHERRVFDAHGLLLQLAGGLPAPVDLPQLYRATLDRARMEQDLKIAGEIQRALLPERERKGAGFQVATASVPCRAIGGDFVDYYDLPNGAFGFVLGDVAGKGPPAALLAAQLHGILATQADVGGAPADILTRVNRVLVRREQASRFATVVYGVLSGEGHLTYCNAGHNPPLLVGRAGVQRLETGGSILGAFKDVLFQNATLRLDPGDLLVVFSDGITEALAADGTEFGEERLLSCINSHRELEPTQILESIAESVHTFTVNTLQSDDQTAMVLRYCGASKKQPG
jgi:predicted ester cyclase